jgi:3-hydroxy-9,10-secoandrosta-1,3,5(10)-triene-9,17-dione monooxygenase
VLAAVGDLRGDGVDPLEGIENELGRATERIFAASGAHSVYDDNRLQAVFRDMNTACHHAVVDFDSTAEMFGRVTLGLPPETPLV